LPQYNQQVVAEVVVLQEAVDQAEVVAAQIQEQPVHLGRDLLAVMEMEALQPYQVVAGEGPVVLEVQAQVVQAGQAVLRRLVLSQEA
jgi:hypothetical protein